MLDHDQLKGQPKDQPKDQLEGQLRVQLKESASQTAGPYVHIGCLPNFVGNRATYDQDLGTGPLFPNVTTNRIKITGRIFDGAGALVKDAMIELWQADHEGRFAKGSDAGWGRQPTHFETGEFSFDTIKPGAFSDHLGHHAPHVSLWIVARGINIGLNSRLYFDDDDVTGDPVLALVDPDRRSTLIAKKQDAGYHLDIVLQGGNETVFFNI